MRVLGVKMTKLTNSRGYCGERAVPAVVPAVPAVSAAPAMLGAPIQQSAAPARPPSCLLSKLTTNPQLNPNPFPALPEMQWSWPPLPSLSWAAATACPSPPPTAWCAGHCFLHVKPPPCTHRGCLCSVAL